MKNLSDSKYQKPTITTIKFIEMREELIETLRALSDKDYQESAWVRGEFPEGIEYDNFDLAVNFLFDDTCLAEKPEDLIGYCLINQQEAKLVRAVTKSIDQLLFKLGDDKSDLEYISSPLWDNVIQESKKACQIIKYNQGAAQNSFMTNKIISLVDWVNEKSQQRQAKHGEKKRIACKKISYQLWEAQSKLLNAKVKLLNAEGKPLNWEYYSVEAQKRLAGFRWQLYQINQPFVWLGKKILKPLDCWSENSNLLRFLRNLSPIAVLAIPLVLFSVKSQRLEEQRAFENNLISAQTEVRQQKAVRDYLSQVINIYLKVKQGNQIQENPELKKLLEATTLSLLDELSINENSVSDHRKNSSSNWNIVEQDQKREVVIFLFNLGLINDSEKTKSALLIDKANLSKVNLSQTYLRGVRLNIANLENANLAEAYMLGAHLHGANLEGANLEGANLEGANLILANLGQANLENAILARALLLDANLKGANLKRANLKGANLKVEILEEATLCETTMPDGTINNRDC